MTVAVPIVYCHRYLPQVPGGEPNRRREHYCGRIGSACPPSKTASETGAVTQGLLRGLRRDRETCP